MTRSLAMRIIIGLLGLIELTDMFCANQVLAADPVSFDQYRADINKIDWKERTITFEKFEKDRLKPDVVVLDLRSEAEYKQGHVKGALLIGADIKEETLKKLVPNKKTEIIVYCTNTFFPSRRISLNNVCLPQIISLGWTNAYVLEDLWHDFKRVDKMKESGLWQGQPH